MLYSLPMAYDFSQFKNKIKDIEAWLSKEYASLRTGRASLAVLDSVQVESYGSKMPINQLANIGSEDPRTLRIAPWDMSLVKDMEKAITVANLGVSVAVDDKGIRVSFPELTTERREQLVKQAKAKLEDAKVSIRKERDATWQGIQNKEKEGGMSEDEKFRLKNEMEKLTQEGTKKLEELTQKKEKEIMS
jgi:ribosome recycling factor